MPCKRKTITPKFKPKKRKTGIPKLRKKLRKTTGLVLDVAGANIMISTAKGLR